MYVPISSFFFDINIEVKTFLPAFFLVWQWNWGTFSVGTLNTTSILTLVAISMLVSWRPQAKPIKPKKNTRRKGEYVLFGNAAVFASAAACTKEEAKKSVVLLKRFASNKKKKSNSPVWQK